MLSTLSFHCRGPLGLAVIVLCLLRGTIPASAQEARFFRIGAAATAGSFFEVGGVLASAISKPAGSLPCEQGGRWRSGTGRSGTGHAGLGGDLRMIASDRIQFGIAQSDIVSWAFAGSGGFAEAGLIKKLRAIASLFPESLHVVVRGDGPVQTLADLKGRRISLGQTGSGTLADSRIVLGASGLTEQDLSVEYLRSGTAAADLQTVPSKVFF